MGTDRAFLAGHASVYELIIAEGGTSTFVQQTSLEQVRVLTTCAYCRERKR
jgi:hypothetical protein